MTQMSPPAVTMPQSTTHHASDVKLRVEPGDKAPAQGNRLKATSVPDSTPNRGQPTPHFCRRCGPVPSLWSAHEHRRGLAEIASIIIERSEQHQ
jgi:hypothetical protein